MRKFLLLLLLLLGIFPAFNCADLTVIGEENSEGEGLEGLPEYWKEEKDPQAIEEKRQKLVHEALGQKKFDEMRKVLAKLNEKEAGGLKPEPTPDNVLLEVQLMEQVNHQSSKDGNAIPRHKVPMPKRVNQPIQDMLFGGDMLLRNDQVEDTFAEIFSDKTNLGEHLHGKRAKRQVIKGKLFPLNQWAISQPICYTFDASITENTRKLVRLGTEFWQNNTCVNFKEDCNWSPRVRVFKGQGCYSEVGRDFMAREQTVSLGSGCEIFGTVTHEFGHVLGFYHHHSRIDRDDNINLIQENIAPSWRAQYTKAPTDRVDNEGLTYELGSIMHYGGTDADTDKIIMAAKHKRYQHTMGRNVSPTFQDVEAINKYYGCMEKCKSGIDCKNGGFRNSRNCQKCICPEGFGGDDCSQLAPGENGEPADCGQIVEAGDDPKELTGTVTPSVDAGRLLSDRAAGCHWQIKAPEGKNVEIQLNSLNGTCTPECFFGAVEIKMSDMTKAGIRVCCEKHMAEIGDKLISDGPMAIVSVYSQRGDRGFNITYKATSDASNKNSDLLGNSASATSSNSFSSLLSVLGGFLGQNQKSSCVDTNPICTTDLGKIMCRLPGYENTKKTTCKKTCNCCTGNC